MLLAEDPGEPGQYGRLMIGIHQNGTMVPVIVQPTPLRIEDAQRTRFTFGGYFWAYRIASHRPTEPAFNEAILQRPGRLGLKFEPLGDGRLPPGLPAQPRAQETEVIVPNRHPYRQPQTEQQTGRLRSDTLWS